MPADMREPDYRSGTEELIMKGRHLDAALERFGDHGIDLLSHGRARPRSLPDLRRRTRSDQYRA
jgi:hypothetical protein